MFWCKLGISIKTSLEIESARKLETGKLEILKGKQIDFWRHFQVGKTYVKAIH